jgi:outer membrane protein assembly factor BamE (lipoprotein component of BamABCDE complex)
MKTRFLSLTACFALGCTLTLGLAACDKQGNAEITKSLNTKITPANVAKLQKGMDRTQVEALFGPPTKVGEVENDMIFKKQTDTWVEGKESLSVTYKNNDVETFNSTVGATTSTTSTDDGQTKTTTTSTTTPQ